MTSLTSTVPKYGDPLCWPELTSAFFLWAGADLLCHHVTNLFGKDHGLHRYQQHDPTYKFMCRV